MAWRNWFLPHKDTHKKAHLISWEALLIYALFFILLQVGFSIISYTKPGILGISSDIDYEKVIELTNIKRQERGLPVLSESEALNKAAKLKAANMFAENYWAHFAPSGKTPWDFILGAGYRFTYAGENLAKNFYTPEDVVNAWMNSPTHRDNLLNSSYKDIGIAVAEGVLNGQKTILIVQEFGTTNVITSKPTVDVQGKQISVPQKDFTSKPELLAGTEVNLTTKTLLDPYLFTKYFGLSLILFMGVLLCLDFMVLYKRRVFRIGSYHVAHMSLLTISATTLLTSSSGSIL